MENWEKFITDNASEKWVAQKMILNLQEHKRKYKDFKIERTVAYFLSTDIKIQRWMCYQSIADINKSIKKSRIFDD